MTDQKTVEKNIQTICKLGKKPAERSDWIDFFFTQRDDLDYPVEFAGVRVESRQITGSDSCLIACRQSPEDWSIQRVTTEAYPIYRRLLGRRYTTRDALGMGADDSLDLGRMITRLSNGRFYLQENVNIIAVAPKNRQLKN